jgi:amino acid adenylation domain-containing protein
MFNAFDHLADGVRSAAIMWADRPALSVGETEYSYAELIQRADHLARAIVEHDPNGHFVAVLGARSAGATVGILAAVLAGRAFVPLHPKFPVVRSAEMLASSRATTLVAGPQSSGLVDVLASHTNIVLAYGWPAADVPVGAVQISEECDPDGPVVPDSARGDVAYVLFTSGSTGRPKGVSISQRNVSAYLNYMVPRQNFGADERCSQMFEPTFDLSVHDMFACWWGGGCLCVVPARSLMAPGPFIIKNRLTQWFSVPSVVAMMAKLGQLRPGAFPTLRRSLFCGEPLTLDVVEAWRQAAPHSTIENLYGPTEATIAIAHYRWDDRCSAAECLNGIVPLGRIFPSQRGKLMTGDEEGAGGGDCELWLSGAQVASAYLNDPMRTSAAFVCDDTGRTWYRTGDRVQVVDGLLHFRGRHDGQVQVLGHRVEIQEVEQVLRAAAGTDLAAVIPWPPDCGRADALYAFVDADVTITPAHLKARCAEHLPDYMVPARVYCGRMPFSAHGKLDRGALLTRLEGLLRGDCN